MLVFSSSKSRLILISSGDQISLADMVLAPFFSAWEFTLKRLLALKPDETRDSLIGGFPKVIAYRDLVLNMPFAKATEYNEDDYAAFVKIYIAKDTSATI